jgi:septum site-determining protein MinD
MGNVEILLLDSPAGLERDALDAMSLADEMILVTTSEVTSISDTLKTKLVADKMGIDILGVVINREKSYDEFLSIEEIEAILEVPIISIIPENPKLISCFSSGEPIMMKEPGSKTSSSFNQLASYLMGQPYQINNRGFVSRFIDSLLGNISIKSKRQ